MKSIAFDKENGKHISDLISEAQSAEIRADYVLFDSWFSSTKVIRFMREKALDVVKAVDPLLVLGRNAALQDHLCPL